MREKIDVSERFNHYGPDTINCYVRTILTTRKCHLGLMRKKLSSPKISTFLYYLVGHERTTLHLEGC